MILKSTSGKLVDILDSRALEFYKSEGSFYLTNIDVLDASSKAVLTSLEINRKLGSIVSDSLYKSSFNQKLDSKNHIERIFEAARTAVENGIEFSIKGYATKSGSGDSLIFEEKELTRVKLTKETIDTLTGEQLSFQIKISYIPELGGICVKFARKNLARKLEKHLISVNERIAENTSTSKHNEEAIQLNAQAVASAKQSIEELKAQIAKVEQSIAAVDGKVDTKAGDSELKETSESIKSELSQTIETKINEVKSLISGVSNELSGKADASSLEEIVSTKLPLIDESINEIKTALRSSPSSENVGKIKDDVDTVKAEVVKVNNTLITKADKSELIGLAAKSAVDEASKKIQEIQDQLAGVVGRVDGLATKEELSNKADTSYVDSKFAEAKTAADDSLERAKAYADYNLALKATKESVEALTSKVDTKADKSYVDGLVIEKTGNIDLSHKADAKVVDIKRDRVFQYKHSVDGQSDSIKGNTVYRIPSMFIDDEGSLYAVADARRSGADQDAIEIVCAKTSNLTGINFNWEFKKVIGARPTKWPDARMMDPTTLVVTHKDDSRVRDGQSVIKVLCGYWEEGNTNWTGGPTWENWKCFSIITSTDGGSTWSQDYFGKEGYTLHNGATVKSVKNWDNNIHGLLGGTDNGIVVNGNTWVYGVQYTLGQRTAYAALMFSKDQGQTWELSNRLPEMVSENSITAFEDGILLVAKSEDPSGKRGRVAYFTRDLGQTWEPFAPLNGALAAYSGKCQSSTLAFKTVSGTEVLLTSIPQTKGSDQWARDRITIYATNKEKGEIVPVKVLKYKPAPAPDGGSVPFGGYSSLYYRRTKDGEFLFVAYEDDLGITVENITDIIPQCEIICRKSEKDFDPAELKKEIRKEISKIKPSEGFKDSHVIFAGNAAELQHVYEGSVVMDDITLPESAEDSDQFEGGLHLDPVDNTDANGAITIPLDVGRFKNGMTYAMEYYLDPSENDYGKMYYSILSFGGDTYNGEREKMTRLEVRVAGAPKPSALNYGVGNSASLQDASVNPVGSKNTLVIVKNESEENVRVYHNGKLVVQKDVVDNVQKEIGASWTKASEVFDKIVIGGNGLSDDGSTDGNFVGRQCKIHIGKVALYDQPMDTFDANILLNPEKVAAGPVGSVSIDTSNLAAKADLDQVKAKVESQTTSVSKVEGEVNTLKTAVKKLEAFHADENAFMGFQNEDVIFAGPIGKLAHTYKGTEETGEITAPATATESDQFVDGLKLNPSNKDDWESAFHIDLDKTRFNSGGMTLAMEYYIDPASANDFAGNYLTLLSFGNNHTWDGEETDVRPMTNLEVRARHRDDYCSINYGYSREVHSEAKGFDAVGNKNTLVAIFNPNDEIIKVYHNNQLVEQQGPDTISTQWNKPQDFYSEINFGGNRVGYDDDASIAGRQTIMHIGRVALYGSAKPELATNAEALLSPAAIIKGKEPQIDTSNFVKKTDITNFVTKEATTDFVNKSEIENLVNKSEITDFVKKAEIAGLVGEAVLENSTEIDTSSFAKKADIENLTSKEEVQKMFDEYVPALDVSDFVSKEDMNSAIDAKVSAIKPAEVDTTNLVKKDELDAAISAKVEEKVSAIKPTVSVEGGSLPAVFTDFMEYLQTPPTKVFDDASVVFAGNAMDIKATYDGFKVNKISKPEVRHESNIFEKGLHLLPSNNQDVSQSFEIGLKKEELTNGVTLAFEFYIDDNDNTDFEKMYYTLCAFGDLNKDDEGDSGNMKPLEVRFVNRANRKTLNMGMGTNKGNEVEVENLNNHKNTLVVVNSAKGNPSDSESPDYIKLYFNGVEVKMPGYQWIGTSWNQPKDVYNKVIIGGNGISDDEAGSRQTCIHIGRVALYKEAKEVTGAESVEALLDAKFKPFSLGGSNVG